jgi:hypothetical protein
MDDKAKDILQRFERLKSNRSTFESIWQDIRDLVRPHASDFNRKSTPGEVRSMDIYDGTACQAADELGGAITAHTTSATDRWFSFEIENSPELNREPEVIEWLESVADVIYSQYNSPRSKFNPSIYEANGDLASFGTSIINQEFVKDGMHLLFRCHPLAACYIEENDHGLVDTVVRSIEWDSRQLMQRFGDACPECVKEDAKNDKKWTVVHSVHPRTDRDLTKYDSGNKRYASCWVLKEKQHMLKEGGYDSLPYHVARWSTLAGEVYGRGPAVKCLPDIRMLNRMEYTLIKAGQRAVMPPLVVPNDGFNLPIKTGPDSIIFKEPGAEEIQSLDFRGNIPIGMEQTNQKREFINRCFYAEWVKFNQKTERQTAYEISELVDQQLRMMGAVVGRLQDEVLGPMLERSFDLLLENRMLPPWPESIKGRKVRITYISTAARAQQGTKAAAMGRYLQELIPMAQVKPDVMDAIDSDAYAQELARLRGVSLRIVRGPNEIAQIRQARAEQEQMQAMAENLEPAAKAVESLAKANSIAPTTV